jgi:hypothetical protein
MYRTNMQSQVYDQMYKTYILYSGKHFFVSLVEDALNESTKGPLQINL